VNVKTLLLILFLSCNIVIIDYSRLKLCNVEIVSVFSLKLVNLAGRCQWLI